MRKRVIVRGIVKWVGEPYVPQHGRNQPKAFKMPDTINRRKRAEAILKFISAWRKKEFTSGDVITNTGVSSESTRRWLSNLGLTEFSIQRGRATPRVYNTQLVKKSLRERKLI